MSPRYDERYAPTAQDVLHALRIRGQDPFRHNITPWTEFMIAAEIAGRKAKRPGYAVHQVIQRNTLTGLLSEMVETGQLIAKTAQEWSVLGRNAPSRAQYLLYTTPEKMKIWENEDARNQ